MNSVDTLINSWIADLSTDPKAMESAFEEMYADIIADAQSEEYYDELKEYRLFELRRSARQTMYRLVDEEQYEMAAILRDFLRKKDWK